MLFKCVHLFKCFGRLDVGIISNNEKKKKKQTNQTELHSVTPKRVLPSVDRTRFRIIHLGAQRCLEIFLFDDW